MESFASKNTQLAGAANANWVGGISIPWMDVEPSQGARNWGALAGQEQALKDVAAKGMTPIVVIRYTPAWAQKYPGYPCGPMASTYFNAFANFFHAVVVRYSVAPYNVKYWEIWNEPDIDHNLNIAPDSPYGCWGDINDTYYGGGYYADMLKVVYPAIKSADTSAKVLIGGLVLDCDPRAGAGCSQTGRDATPPKFLEGILHNGGGAYFDGVSIHAYDNWVNPSGYSNPNWQSSSLTTGPVFIAKVQYVKSLLSSYNVSGKFLVNTESGMVSWSCTPWPTINASRETEKSYYVAEAYSAAIAQGLIGNLWFTMEGSWNCTGLINPDYTTLPAYTAYQFSSSELRNSSWVRDITDYAGVKGYEFNRGDRRIWVLWSLDGSSHTISLPGVPLAVHHVNGASITPSVSITLGLEPIYFEWNT